MSRRSLALLLPILAALAVVLLLSLPAARAAETACPSVEGWTQIPTLYAPRSHGSPGITSVARDISAPGRLFITTLISGLNVSEDCGQSWGSRGFSGASQVVVDQVGTIYVAFWNDLIRVSHDRGSTWSRAGLPFGDERLGIDAFAIGYSPTRPGLAFATFGRRGVRVNQEGGRSDDGGLTWTGIDGWVGGGNVVPGVRPEDVYVATFQHVYRSSDGGATFERIASFDAHISGFAMAPDGSRFWLSTEGGELLISRDNAASWSPVASVPPGGKIVYLSADPARPNTIYAVVEPSQVWSYREPADAGRDSAP